MLMRMTQVRCNHLARAAAIGSAAALLWAAAPRAATLENLYEIAQPVGASREEAFQEALRAVLVRVSGRRDAPAHLTAELANPRKYAQRFGFTADNVLQVGFDSVSIDKLLADAGLPIWGRERPATLVMLGLEDGAGATRWVSAITPAGEREALERAAYERGLPLVWATMDVQDRALAEGDVSASSEALLAAAQRYGANAALLGRGRDGAVRWTLVSSDGVAETQGGLADGVHLAADVFARVFAASGASLASVVVEVAGVEDLDAYAATLNYLESLTLVRAAGVEQVAGDVVRFRLAVRGDAETLRRAIALDNRLLPAAPGGADASSAVDRLSLRFNR